MKEYRFICKWGWRGLLSRGEEYRIISTELKTWSDRHFKYTQRYFTVEDKDHDDIIISRGDLIESGASAYMLAQYVKENG